MVYHTTLVDMTDDFKTRLRKAYDDDAHWGKIRHMLKPPADSVAGTPDTPSEGAGDTDTPDGSDTPNGTNDPTREHTKLGLSFAVRDNLIYHINGEGIRRLYIPTLIEQEIFE